MGMAQTCRSAWRQHGSSVRRAAEHRNKASSRVRFSEDKQRSPHKPEGENNNNALFYGITIALCLRAPPTVDFVG